MPPLLDNKDPSAPSVFVPSALLREARRQKGIPDSPVPPVCVLDPDGDIVRRLKATGRGKLAKDWPATIPSFIRSTLQATLQASSVAPWALRSLFSWRKNSLPVAAGF